MTIWHGASYATVLGLAYQSTYYERRMNIKLLEMTAASGRAALLESAAVTDSELSLRSEQQAAIDEAVGEGFQEKALALEAESERDAALAASDEVTGEELAAKAAEEEAAATAHFAAAAADEAIFDADMVEATAEAADAALKTTEAESDGAAVAACEWIPFLDIICDILGGITAIGLEAKAAEEAAESAAEFAAAISAKSDEATETLLGEESEVQFLIDESAATDVEAMAAEEEAKAEAELAEAETYEEEAEEEFAKRNFEEEVATEEAAKADVETVEAEEEWDRAMMHGLSAFWSALMSACASVLALFFFVARIFLGFFVPGIMALCGYAASAMQIHSGCLTKPSGLMTTVWNDLPKRRVGHLFLHCGAFVTTLVSFAPHLSSLEEKTDIRARGAFIITFAFMAGVLQGISMHALPHLLAIMKKRFGVENSADLLLAMNSCSSQNIVGVALAVSYSFLSAFVYLLPLFAMEALILWVNFGHDVFTVKCHPWLIWTLFVGGVLFYHKIFEPQLHGEIRLEHQILEDSKRLMLQDPDAAFEKAPCFIDEEKNINEATSLLARKPKHKSKVDSSVYSDSSISGELVVIFGSESSSSMQSSPQGTTAYVDDYSFNSDIDSHLKPLRIPSAVLSESDDARKGFFHSLQLPFEILIASCMMAILSSSLPYFHKLWPAFMSKFASVHPHWIMHLALVGIGVIFLASSLMYCMSRAHKETVPDHFHPPIGSSFKLKGDAGSIALSLPSS